MTQDRPSPMKLSEFYSRWNDAENWSLCRFDMGPQDENSCRRLHPTGSGKLKIVAGIEDMHGKLGRIYDRVESLPLHNYETDHVIACLLGELHEKLTARVKALQSIVDHGRPSGKETIVVIAGAGFSAGFGIPVTKQLGRKMLEICHGPENDEDRNWWNWWHQDPRARDALLQEFPFSAFLGKDGELSVDVEHFLAVWIDYCEQRKQMGSSSEEAKFTKFVENLVAWFYHLSKRAEESAEHRGRFFEFADWLSKTHARFDVRVITFNYDVLFERLCRRSNLDYRYRWPGQSSNPVLIRKVHGSVNWVHSSSPFEVQNLPSENLGSTGDFYYQAVLDADVPTFATTPEGQAMILPAASKRYDAVYRAIWQDACGDVLSASKIIVVGYSFPALDIYAREYLAQSLREWQNRTGRKLWYILPRRCWPPRWWLPWQSRRESDWDRVRTVLRPSMKVQAIRKKWQVQHFQAWLRD